jgi:hypothetical protein
MLSTVFKPFKPEATLSDWTGPNEFTCVDVLDVGFANNLESSSWATVGSRFFAEELPEVRGVLVIVDSVSSDERLLLRLLDEEQLAEE